MKKVLSAPSLMKTLLVTLVLFLSGCYDDSIIRERLDNYEIRLQALERMCAEMNTNISSLQQIVTALQNNDFVTDVMPVTENGKAVGYTITFSKSGSVTIYHGQDGKDGVDGKDGKDGKDGADGKDGKDGEDGKDGADGKDGRDGSTPIVGLRQDTDGVWYWTLSGEWLLDAQGRKIRAVGIDGKDGKDGADGKDGQDGHDGADGKDGQDGKDGTDGQDGKDGQDGVTPQLKIEEDYWYLSYDGGKTWTKLGRATGKDGQDGQDGQDGTDGTDGTDGKDGTSFFKSVTYNATQVVLTLADGKTVLTLPRELELSVTFIPENEYLSFSVYPTSLDIQYKIQATVASADEISLEVVSSEDILAKVQSRTEVFKDNVCSVEGVIHVETGSSVSAYSKVTVFVSDNRKVFMRSFYFREIQ